jgi:hypothetical protein
MEDNQMNHEGHMHGDHMQGDMGMGMGMHHRGHWGCCILPIISKVFWAVSIVFVIASWVSVTHDKLVWGYGAQWWIVNALMFGVLAIYGRGGKGCGACCVSGMHKVN